MTTEHLDGGAVREIERLTNDASPTIMVDGRTYARVAIHPVNEPVPDCVDLSTLESMTEFVKSPFGLMANDEYVDGSIPRFLHVESPTKVVLWTDEFGAFRRRVRLASASAVVPPFRFGEFVDPETFNIALQATFDPSPERANVLALVGGLRAEAVQTLEDDGVSQTATGRRGVVAVQAVKVPNPVVLRPRRTFDEVDQPASPFVLRLRGGGDGKLPACALFEADGGLWRLTAIASIKAWLKANLPADFPVFG